MLEYILPSEDLEDLNSVQRMSGNIENYDFTNLINKYDLENYIISIIIKNKDEIKVLSKIYLNNSLKVDNQKYINIDLNNEEDLDKILKNLKTIYENYWKKNNEINTSIKLPLTISVNSKDYKKIQHVEKIFNTADLISKFYILKFDSLNIYYRIIYNGSPNTFLNNFSKKNIDLEIKNKVWTIK